MTLSFFKNILLIILLNLFGAFDKIYSQSNTSSFETKLANAIDLLYNFEFEKAEIALNKLRIENKHDLKPELFTLKLYVWKYVGDRSQDDFEKFKTLFDEILDKAKKRIHTNEKDYDAYYILATIYGYRSIMDLMTRNYLNGVFSANKSLSWAEKLISKKSDYYDAYLWRGIFNFLLTQVPSTVRTVLSTLGLSGNLKQGINDLKLVTERGTYSKIEAMYFLSQFYSSFLLENLKAKDLLIDLYQKYPDNELFSYSLAAEFLKADLPNEAAKILEQLVSNKKFKIQSLKNFSLFILGDSYYYQNEFLKAKYYYKKFIELEEQKNYKTTANFRLGVSEFFTANVEASKKIFAMNSNQKVTIDEDKLYKKFSANVILKSYDTSLVKIFRTYNLIKSGKYLKALEELNELQQLNLKEHSNLIKYYSALSNYKLNRLNEAKKHFIELIKINETHDLWINGFSYLYLGVIELKSGNTTSAKKYWKELQELKGFEFENYLKSVARNLIAYNTNP